MEMREKMNVRVTKKDETQESFNVDKILNAVNKSASRAMYTLTDEDKFNLIDFVKEAAAKQMSFKDYKTELQEIIQKNPAEHLTYVLVGESGPDHDKRFEVEVRLNSNVMGCGMGKSKKLAEQEAARQALELMGIKN